MSGTAQVIAMPQTSQSDVTRLMNAAAEPASSQALLALVYDQLRKIAQQRMNAERRDHTLEATALVHEAYLKLVGDQDVHWAGRAHFFAAAAEAMRRILIDHARKRGAIKRGGALRPIASVIDLADDENISAALMVDDLISRLERDDAFAARVVRLRFFAGLSLAETARSLDVSEITVSRKWTFARAWLAQQWECAGTQQSPEPAAKSPESA